MRNAYADEILKIAVADPRIVVLGGAIACEVGAEQFLTFNEDQAGLAETTGFTVWKGEP